MVKQLFNTHINVCGILVFIWPDVRNSNFLNYLKTSQTSHLEVYLRLIYSCVFSLQYGNSRKWRSVFKLHVIDERYVLQSAANPDWFVNFRKRKGTPYHYTKRRRKITRKRKTMKFIIKTIKNSTEETPPGPNLGNFEGTHNKLVENGVKLYYIDENGRKVRHAGRKRHHRSYSRRSTTEAVISNISRTRSLGKT